MPNEATKCRLQSLRMDLNMAKTATSIKKVSSVRFQYRFQKLRDKNTGPANSTRFMWTKWRTTS